MYQLMVWQNSYLTLKYISLRGSLVYKNHSSSFSILFINPGYVLSSLILLVRPFVAHLSAGPCSTISSERNHQWLLIQGSCVTVQSQPGSILSWRLIVKYFHKCTLIWKPATSFISLPLKPLHWKCSDLFQLPLDLSLLSEAERKARLRKREPKEKILVKDDIDDDFDSSQYRKLTKKRL